MNLGEGIIRFYGTLNPPSYLPEGVEVMDPYKDPATMDLVKKFYSKYFNDQNPRVMLIGINPGRFGGGITGQAEAIRLAITRALVAANEENKAILKPEGLLTRDPRMVERKKFGQKKARKKFQFSKR